MTARIHAYTHVHMHTYTHTYSNACIYAVDTLEHCETAFMLLFYCAFERLAVLCSTASFFKLSACTHIHDFSCINTYIATLQKDETTALDLLQQATEAGHANARILLSMCRAQVLIFV